jgi:hypothetical protein
MVVACSSPLLDSVKAADNLPSLTDSEKTRLSSLGPEFRSLMLGFDARVAARGIASSSADIGEGRLAIAKDFLKEKFGTDYMRYIVTGNITMTDGLGNQVSFGKPQSRNLLDGYDSYVWGDFYNLGAYARYARLPWGTWCWVGHGIYYTLDTQTYANYAALSETIYADEVTPQQDVIARAVDSNGNGILEPSETVNSQTQVSGNMKWGFFPAITGIKYYFQQQNAIIQLGIRSAHGLIGSYDFTRGLWKSGWLAGSM